jgi:WXG100 family type VII secretion target
MPLNVAFNTDDIAARAAKIQSTAGEIESQLGLLTQEMAAFAETYKGAGANAFQEVYAKWQQTQGQIREELAEIGTALQKTGQVREQVETEIAGQWANAL